MVYPSAVDNVRAACQRFISVPLLQAAHITARDCREREDPSSVRQLITIFIQIKKCLSSSDYFKKAKKKKQRKES